MSRRRSSAAWVFITGIVAISIGLLFFPVMPPAMSFVCIVGGSVVMVGGIRMGSR